MRKCFCAKVSCALLRVSACSTSHLIGQLAAGSGQPEPTAFLRVQRYQAVGRDRFGDQIAISFISKPQLAQAIDCLMGLTWDDYQGQVVEFLDTESRANYGTESAWETLQALVLDTLGTHA